MTQTMRRILFFAVLLLFSIHIQAQDSDMLGKIRQANATVQSFETTLNNTLVKPNKKTEQKGMLYFVNPDKFAALFDNGKHMIVNVDRLKMNIGLFRGTFRLKGDGMMRSLSNIFLYGFQGRCQELAQENNYSIKVIDTGQYQQVYCTSNKKSLFGIGYKTVIFNYDKDSFLLRQIILVDNSDNVDTYTITNTRYNVPVSDERFFIK